MSVLIAILSLTGINFTFWAVMGLVRFISERPVAEAQTPPPDDFTSWVDVFTRIRWRVGLAYGISITLMIISVSLANWSGWTIGSTTIMHLDDWPIYLHFPLPLLLSFTLWPMLSVFLVRQRGDLQESLSIFLYSLLYWATCFLALEVWWDWTFEPTSSDTALALLLILGSGALALALAGGERRWRERLQQRAAQPPPPQRLGLPQVAVIMAAHNEAKGIGQTLAALRATGIPMDQVFVGDDASSDDTAAIVRSYGCRIETLSPNRGKAKVLRYVLEHFSICDRFQAVMILDADIVVHPDYFQHALPHFDDPTVAAVPGRSIPMWYPHHWPNQSMFVTSYRIRLWRMLQFGLRYGQTWRFTNMSTIIPGAMSVYRSSVLRQLQIDAPGLIIEDYNMTFEVHHRRLGRIAYDAKAMINAHQPSSVREYVRQVRRWYLGWWQTVRRHGFWPSAFWFFTTSFVLEMLVYGFFVLLIPIMAITIALNHGQPVSYVTIHGLTLGDEDVTFSGLIIAVLAIDYLTTILVTLIEKKPMMLVYGLGYFLLRYLDALYFIVMLPVSFFTKSDGRWVSPVRVEAKST